MIGRKEQLGGGRKGKWGEIKEREGDKKLRLLKSCYRDE